MAIDTIYPRVASIVADVLAIDEEEISLNKRLIADLGAESIDFLDLTFQLEREFNIKIPRGQIEKDARGSLTEGEFEQSGMVTDAGIQALKTYLSEVSEEHFPEDLRVSHIPTLFTVETLCKLVLRVAGQTTEAVAETTDAVV